MCRRVLAQVLSVALLSTAGSLAFAAAPSDAAAKPGWTKNCTALNKRYPHGLGRKGAHDHTSSGTPVTSFKRSTRLYRQAMSYNKGLDRDKDGVACEKR